MTARMRNGWLLVDYSGPELVLIEIGTGTGETIWKPAYLDWVDGQRVAKIRPPVTGTTPVWLRCRDVVTRVGRVDV